MATHKNQGREYEVHTHFGDRARRVLREKSLEAAALAYVEEFGLSFHADENEITVYVRDIARGDSHCFKVHLDTGVAETCT